MKILVTGGAGFIGSHTVDRLLKEGYDVKIVDNLQKPVHMWGKPDYIPQDAEFIFGDVRDKRLMEYALEDVDIVFHFAAYQDYLPDFSTYFHVNAVSTALIYEIIVEKKLPVKKVIVASSQAVLGEGLYRCNKHGEIIPDIRLEEQLSKGDWEHHCPFCGSYMQYLPTPEDKIKPQNQYAMSKYAQESICINLGKRYGIPSVALRYSIVQGARQSFYNAYSGAMRVFSLSLYQRKPPIIFEDGNQIRDFVNIHDVVDANLLVMEKDEANYQVFNVGGGKAVTINEFYEMVDRVYKAGIEPIRDGSYRYGDTRHILSDISKLRRLGWEPKRSVEDSILEYKEYLELYKPNYDVVGNSVERMKRLNIIRKSIG
ncbi:MAG: NAD-dependent epimerase/dehydratase family protein [Candidatus Marinimicrobia bacterium]|nr:NAD-dependent epimerase/dehydratase family protein [Candidatus Neomarinimicrobiota bacterium]